MNEKQIDNISKYCYDMSKLIMGVAVVGNLVSDQYSLKDLWIGLITAMILLLMGLIIDRMEVNKNDKY